MAIFPGHVKTPHGLKLKTDKEFKCFPHHLINSFDKYIAHFSIWVVLIMVIFNLFSTVTKRALKLSIKFRTKWKVIWELTQKS